LVEKDLSYAVKTAQSNGGKLPIAAATQHNFNEAIQQGHGKDNITGIAQLYI
jgi:3-hydroxyisobutyrate dehydrogenase-like beta-hydroxyacid dehydrogenase